MREPPRSPPSMLRFTALALWLGIIGFGGGFAVAQRVKHVVVGKRGWMREEDFLETFGVSSALPGTASTNLLTILGLRFGGVAGAVLAASAFLVPSVALMIAFGAGYEHLRHLGGVSRFLDGMSVATVGVVAAVSVDMGRAAIKKKRDAAVAAFAVAALVSNVLTLVEVIAIAAVFGAIALRPRATRPSKSDDELPPTSLRSFAPALFAALPPGLVLFVVFARIGLVTFGGGFAMIPAIEREVVSAKHWLDEAAFNDAMVLGQITPGPVAIAATFIGYRVSGLLGALLATLGMFGPPAVLSVLAGRSIEAFRTSPVVQGGLHGIAPAVVGVIAAAAVALFRTAVRTPAEAAIAFASMVVLVAFRKLPPVFVLAAAGVIGLFFALR